MNFIDVKFEINFSTITAFVIGIILGMVLLFLFYVLSSLRSIRKRRIIISHEIDNVLEEDIKELISLSQKQFVTYKKENKTFNMKVYRDIIFSLINQIAYRFYPKSKHPIAELTIDELILLDRYLINRIDSFTSKKGIRVLKGVKLTTIIKILNAKKSVDNNKITKSIKKNKLDVIGSYLWKTLNVLNPVTWAKVLVVNPSIKLIINKICLTLIAVVGQETYHVYSKKVFEDAKEEIELIELLKQIEEDEEKELITQ